MNATVREKQEKLLEQAKVNNESGQEIRCVSKIIDTTVKNFQGFDLGEIKSLVFEPESDQIACAVISFGGISDSADKLFAVPWKALRWTGDKTHYVLHISRATLEKAPGFHKNHWSDHSNIWDLQREELEHFYSVTP
jgi:sporulation protein YlmC with PRC-barrel domain